MPGANLSAFLGSYFTPQVQNPAGNIITSACQTFAQTFVATGTENWMVFGNFRTDAQTHYQNGNPGTSYFYIDDISVRQVCTANILTVNATSVSICPNDTGVIMATPSGGIPPYSFVWNPGGNTSSSIVVFPADSSSYSVTVTDSTQASASTVVAVNVYPEITATTTTKPSSCEASDGRAIVNVSGGTAPYHYNWINTGVSDPILYALAPGSYTCEISDINGCSKTIPVTINEERAPDLNIPNIFTPNQDGLNDIYFIEGFCVNIKDIRIYNRWGELIKSLPDNTGWNGLLTNNHKASDGMYYILFQSVDGQGKTQNHQVFVTLMR